MEGSELEIDGEDVRICIVAVKPIAAEVGGVSVNWVWAFCGTDFGHLLQILSAT